MAVTGTPGSGKSRFAKRLAKGIKDSEVIELSYVVEKYKLYSSKDRYGSKIIKTEGLSNTVKRLVREEKGVAIIVGHLFPELRVMADITLVTRAGLATLAKRLEERGYQKGKISENLVSEALDYCGQNSKRFSREIYEVESDREKASALRYAIARASGRKAKRPVSREIEKIADIAKLAKGGNPYGL
ncbi:MAG: AAA family ATPase [Candidatus Micrarchaeota archaeon]|nr:AAA family ATPase [Candidatus Micrarchaeota archaeon]